MFDQLLAHINQGYLKLLKKVAKWALIVFGVTVLGLGVGVKLVLPKVMHKKEDNSNSVLYRDQNGNTAVLYQDKVLPKNYSEEMSSLGPELIYENQNRSVHSDEVKPEDAPAEDSPKGSTEGEGKKLLGRDRVEIPNLATQFLSRWETFSSNTSEDEYRNSLWQWLSPEAQDNSQAIIQRKDNYQSDAIGPGRSVGSRMVFDGFVPKDTLIAQRYDGKTAYVTAIGEVVLGGQSLVLRGKRYIRSYALVLVNTQQGWRVSRVVGQTLKEVIE